MRQGVTVISFGDRVHAPTGAAGRIRYVVLDRSRRKLGAVVLRRGLMHAHYVLPAPIVLPGEGMDGQLQLHAVGKPMVSPLPRTYGPDDVAAALDQGTASSDGIPAWPFDMRDFMLLRAGQPIYGPDGPVGVLQRIVVQWPGRELVALIMCVDRLRRRCVRIPRTSIVGFTGDQIHIDLTRTAAHALPEYRPDGAMRSAINHALHHDEAVRRIDGRMIAVDVSDGCAILTGHLADGRNRHRAEQLVRQVRGVRRVTNELVADAHLTHDIAQALTQVDHASRTSVGFTVTHGAVVLFGAVPDARVRQDIEMVVAEVPDLRMVINEITAPGTPQPAANQRMLQPRRGQNVFARDGYIGRIEHVAMDPRLRQVMAIVVDSLAQVAARDWLDDAPQRRRMLVVPVHAIETLSPVEVFLKIDSRTVAMAGEFHPKSYVAPPVGWRPPFPYRREEVVFTAPVETATNRLPIATDRRPSAQSYVALLDGGSRDTRKRPVGAVASD